MRARRVRWVLLGLAMLAGSPAWGATVSVLAAASLTEAFRTIGKDFEAAHPGTKVEFNFAGSSTLARQIVEGAPADVFASACDENMKKVVDAGDVAGTPERFVRNRLAIIVPRGNPKHLKSLADLARPGLIISLAAPGVSVGRYAAEAFAKANTPVPGASREAEVKAVVTRVSMGEADGGVVYVTDVAAGGDKVEMVPIPEAQNVLASYPIAVLKGAANAPGARDFVAYVLSPSGQRVLAASGFLPP
ncbi:MAG TPA: molybdate ABC transporter substrate-binding protein [Candidatus Binatia bacterium]|nr:molybdate ABC transporter substrate-binding protein [Candidatus Binatia bacterium]